MNLCMDLEFLTDKKYHSKIGKVGDVLPRYT